MASLALVSDRPELRSCVSISEHQVCCPCCKKTIKKTEVAVSEFVFDLGVMNWAKGKGQLHLAQERLVSLHLLFAARGN